MFQLKQSRCVSLRKSGFVSLIVQLLHSHTYERTEVDLETFINKYVQKSALRQQLSQSLRTFLQRSAKDEDDPNLNLELQIHDDLDVLRSFVGKLYAQKHDRGLDYPWKKMNQIHQYSKVLEHKAILEKLGGVFVIVDILQAMFRFSEDRDTHPRVDAHNMRMYSYQALAELIQSANTHPAEFISLNKPFLTNIKLLLNGHSRTGFYLLMEISTFIQTFSVTLAAKGDILERTKLVEPMLRAIMRITEDYGLANGLEHLLVALRNFCVFREDSKRQLCRVDGWANFLLDLLDRSIEVVNGDSPQSHHYEYVLWSVCLLADLKNLMLDEEKERLMKLCRTPTVCDVITLCLETGLVTGPVAWALKSLLEKSDSALIDQLRTARMVPALEGTLSATDLYRVVRENLEKALAILRIEE